MPRHHKTRTAADRALALRKDLTAAELALWQSLRRSQLGVRFRRQEPIGPYIADFVCLERGLVVEADGQQHDGSDHDRRRDQFLARLGFRVMRFENHDIAWHLGWVIEEIKAGLGFPPYPIGSAAAVLSPQRGD